MGYKGGDVFNVLYIFTKIPKCNINFINLISLLLLYLSIVILCVIVIMPPSALDHLTRLNINYPMLFKLTNRNVDRVTHCGVLEFVADEEKVYLPHWVIFIFIQNT